MVCVGMLDHPQILVHATTCKREVLSFSACMYNLDASVFYIALVLLHEYFTQKAKLLPYTTTLNSPNAMTTFLKLQACKFDFSSSMTSLQAL